MTYNFDRTETSYLNVIEDLRIMVEDDIQFLQKYSKYLEGINDSALAQKRNGADYDAYLEHSFAKLRNISNALRETSDSLAYQADVLDESMTDLQKTL